MNKFLTNKNVFVERPTKFRVLDFTYLNYKRALKRLYCSHFGNSTLKCFMQNELSDKGSSKVFKNEYVLHYKWRYHASNNSHQLFGLNIFSVLDIFILRSSIIILKY